MNKQVSISNKPLMPSTRPVEDTYPAETPAPIKPDGILRDAE